MAGFHPLVRRQRTLAVHPIRNRYRPRLAGTHGFDVSRRTLDMPPGAVVADIYSGEGNTTLGVLAHRRLPKVGATRRTLCSVGLLCVPPDEKPERLVMRRRGDGMRIS